MFSIGLMYSLNIQPEISILNCLIRKKYFFAWLLSTR